MYELSFFATVISVISDGVVMKYSFTRLRSYFSLFNPNTGTWFTHFIHLSRTFGRLDSSITGYLFQTSLKIISYLWLSSATNSSISCSGSWFSIKIGSLVSLSLIATLTGMLEQSIFRSKVKPKFSLLSTASKPKTM